MGVLGHDSPIYSELIKHRLISVDWDGTKRLDFWGALQIAKAGKSPVLKTHLEKMGFRCPQSEAVNGGSE